MDSSMDSVMAGAMDDEPMEELEAEQVFLLMRKEYRISRNVRAQWYFNHLDQVIQVPKRHHLVSRNTRITIC